jgi:regulator of RNase E activity RraA
MCERFGRIYTGAITDILDEMNYYHQTLPWELRPIKFGIRTAGAAFPVLGHPRRQVDYEASIRPILKMLGEVPADSVVVYETNDLKAAQLGELSVTSIKTRGCRGAIVDGGVRDVDYILREDFPVWARYQTPADSVPRWQIVDWNCEVTIGDVRLKPGDLIVADHDGIVAIPQTISEDVLLQCEELVKTESKVRAAVSQGIPPLEAYDQYGEF